MKFEIDTVEKSITIIDQASIGEFNKLIKQLGLDDSWSIKGNYNYIYIPYFDNWEMNTTTTSPTITSKCTDK